MLIAEPLLNRSDNGIFKSTALAENKVSPSNGALLIIETPSRETFVFGKLLHKLKSAFSKSSEALILLLVVFLTSSIILPSKTIGITMIKQ